MHRNRAHGRRTKRTDKLISSHCNFWTNDSHSLRGITVGLSRVCCVLCSWAVSGPSVVAVKRSTTATSQLRLARTSSLCDFAKLKTSPLGVAVHYNDDHNDARCSPTCLVMLLLLLLLLLLLHCIVCATSQRRLHCTVYTHSMLIHRHAVVMQPVGDLPRHTTAACLLYAICLRRRRRQ